MGLWLQAGVGSLSHTSVLGGGSWSQSGKLKACGVFAQSALHKERGRGSRDGRAKASRQCQRPGEARRGQGAPRAQKLWMETNPPDISILDP